MSKKRLLLFFSVLLTLCLTVKAFLPQQFDVTFVGTINMEDGLGRHAAEFIESFHHSLKINFIPVYMPAYHELSPRVKKTLKNPSSRLGSVIFFTDCVWTPFQDNSKVLDQKTEDHIAIAYSMFESSEIPPEWVTILNAKFDLVAVPDPFLVEVYQRCGVKIPIVFVPLGVNLQPFLQKPLKTHKHSPMIFASLGACIERKNFPFLIDAFHKAFGNREDVLLMINSRNSDITLSESIRHTLEERHISNVMFSELSLRGDAYRHLFDSIDCFVSFSKGEGFSIQPREAMALGIPVLISNNTAHATICNSGLVQWIPSTQLELTNHWWGLRLGKQLSYGYQYNSDLDDAAKALLDLFNHYDTYVAKGAEARKWASHYDIDKAKALFHTLIRPKQVILGKENLVTEDALITTSQSLYCKYQKLVCKNK